MTHHALDSRDHAMTADANRLTSGATDVASKGFNLASAVTIPTLQIRAFIGALERLGYDATEVLSRANLRRADLDDPDEMISCSVWTKIMGAVMAEFRRPNLPAHLGSVTPLGTYPLLDYLVVTADTVADALEQLVRFFHVTGAPVRCTVVRDGELVRLQLHPGSDAFTTQYETSLIVHHLRAETDRRLRVSRVSLMCEVEDRRDLERVLGCPVDAPSTWSGLELHRDMLDLPLRRRDSTLRRLLERHADDVTSRSDSSADRTMVARVRDVLSFATQERRPGNRDDRTTTRDGAAHASAPSCRRGHLVCAARRSRSTRIG